MSILILPKTHIDKLNVPLIFLAGPIRSAPNWQDDAIKILFSKEQNLIIASPRKSVGSFSQKYIVKGNQDYFPRQRAWERHYLDIASKYGSIMFWLPEEEEHHCEKAYGAMTRVELGQAMTNYRYNKNFKFCVGSDGNFSELSTILYDLSLDAPDKEVFHTLEETCEEALRLAFNR
jgi:hypothetical protein